MVKRLKCEEVVSCRNVLGEAPVWDHRTHALYWVDILRPAVHRYTEGELMGEFRKQHSVFPLSKTSIPTAILLTSHPGLFLLCERTSLYLLNLDTMTTQFVVKIPCDSALYRLNDAKVDPAGCIMVGTMSLSKPRITNGAAVYRVHGQDVSLSSAIGPVTVSNGMDWAPGHKEMYYIDSPTKVITAFAYHPLQGPVDGTRRTVADLSQHCPKGAPDGMCVDSLGRCWVAMFRAGAVWCLCPQTGALLAEIMLPCPGVTSVAFGGHDQRTLYITTAQGSSEEEVAGCTNAQAGNLFRCRVDDAVGMLPFVYRMEGLAKL